MQGSEKTLTCFERLRTDQIGYDVIPADRWTRAEESATPAAVIYVDGTADLYLRPFYQDEYNDLHYRRAMKNDASGSVSITTWAKVQQVEDAVIEVNREGGGGFEATEQPFFVEQSSGTAMGYTIVAFDAHGEHAGLEPSLRAFRIPTDSSAAVSHLRLTSLDGHPLGGERQLRVTVAPRHPLAALPAALFPFLAFAVIRVRRYRRLHRFDESTRLGGESEHG